MKKRNKVLLTGATLLTLGGVTGYAATNIFGNLETIKDNYDITFNFAKSQKQKAEELQTKLNQESGNKEQLQNEINKLETDIENLKTTHAAEITNKNAEINNKQIEINAKQDEINAKIEEVNEKQASINQLNNELGKLNGELAQVNAKVIDLLNHTNNGVQELTGGE